MATKKVTVNLPESVVDLLKALAEEREITMTEALRQAIEMNAFLRKETAGGAKILLEREQGQVRQVVFQ